MDRGETDRYDVTTAGSEEVRAFIPLPLPQREHRPEDSKNARQNAKIAAKRHPRRARPPPPPPLGSERGRPCRALPPS